MRIQNKQMQYLILGLLAFAALVVGLLYNDAPKMVQIEETPPPLAASASSILVPSAPGKQVYKGSDATIDASNTSQGYVMVRYHGASPKVKMQITGSDRNTYTYNLSSKRGFEAFPLTSGDGTYTINVFEHVVNNQYALVMSQRVAVKLDNPLLPYLYPSQYVNYNASSTTVAKGGEIAAGAANKLEVVQRVYRYVTNNLTYDTEKASSVQSGYLPVVDSVLAAGKGICFDYAAVMATMLRTQGIPTRLEVGYVSGGIYHAWVSVYLEDQGWVNGMIYFDGKTWKMMDPTFASNAGGSSEITQFIGNASNYMVKYVY